MRRTLLNTLALLAVSVAAVRADAVITISNLSAIPSVPDGGMTLVLLGGALMGLATLRRKFGV